MLYVSQSGTDKQGNPIYITEDQWFLFASRIISVGNPGGASFTTAGEVLRWEVAYYPDGSLQLKVRHTRHRTARHRGLSSRCVYACMS